MMVLQWKLNLHFCESLVSVVVIEVRECFQFKTPSTEINRLSLALASTADVNKYFQ
jgi:hypothetical protein